MKTHFQQICRFVRCLFINRCCPSVLFLFTSLQNALYLIEYYLFSYLSFPLFLYLLLLLHKPVDVYSVFSNSGGSGFWQWCLDVLTNGRDWNYQWYWESTKYRSWEHCCILLGHLVHYFWVPKDTNWKQSHHSPVIQFCMNCSLSNHINHLRLDQKKKQKCI